jgi:hypothetical protein
MRRWAIIALCGLTIAFAAAICFILFAGAMSHPALNSDMEAFEKSVRDDVRNLCLISAAVYAALCAATVYAGRTARSRRSGL